MKVEDDNLVNTIKGIIMETKRATDEICAFNSEKKKNGALKSMCITLEFFRKDLLHVMILLEVLRWKYYRRTVTKNGTPLEGFDHRELCNV